MTVAARQRSGDTSVSETFQEISPSDFFYRNRDIAGFTSPSRAIYSTIRELAENSLDACEIKSQAPDIYLRLSHEEGPTDGPAVYRVRIEDNGSGVPSEVIPSAFGQVLFGSKYKLRQARGTFGLGGKMALLYGQITTHSQAIIISSTSSKTPIYRFDLMIDIQNNKPVVLKKKRETNSSRWQGTIIEFRTEADYARAMPKILDYLKQTAIIVPYANLTLVDPRGRIYRFVRGTLEVPEPPKETLPHPHGVDVETLQRMIRITKTRTLSEFLRKHFQRIGETTAQKFLREQGLSARKSASKLTSGEIVRLAGGLKTYEKFLAPDPSCLSPLGEALLATGIRKELGITDDQIKSGEAFVVTHQRRPATYSGFPFIVEVGLACSKTIPPSEKITLYRFANKIPLLFDEASDVSWKVVNEMIDWKNYNVLPTETPLAVFVHLCSTKVPYKTVGKEFIADRPEVEHEILNAIREAARQMRLFLSRKMHIEHERRRLDVFEKYLPRISEFSTKLAKKKKPPDYKPLLRSLVKYGAEED